MGKEVMGKKENEMAQEKERPAGSQSLFRGLMLIEILSNYPNGCPLAHLSELLVEMGSASSQPAGVTVLCDRC
ncbi:hypothetical protein DJICPGNB_17875 [Escherichia coli]|nr:hypothetical protein DJICPGNB_17875 [Escherichia coli]